MAASILKNHNLFEKQELFKTRLGLCDLPFSSAGSGVANAMLSRLVVVLQLITPDHWLCWLGLSGTEVQLLEYSMLIILELVYPMLHHLKGIPSILGNCLWSERGSQNCLK